MIVQEMQFEGEKYTKFLALREELQAREGAHNFHPYMKGADRKVGTPETLHLAYPTTDEGRWAEKTIVTFYNWPAQNRGQISFVTPSIKAFERALRAVTDLLKEPIRPTKSAIEVIALA